MVRLLSSRVTSRTDEPPDEDVPRVAALACLRERVEHAGIQDVRMARCEGGQARGSWMLGCAPLHDVDEELVIQPRQLQDDVTRLDGQECPSRQATSIGL
jgi:hypothetical protein